MQNIFRGYLHEEFQHALKFQRYVHACADQEVRKIV